MKKWVLRQWRRLKRAIRNKWPLTREERRLLEVQAARKRLLG